MQPLLAAGRPRRRRHRRRHSRRRLGRRLAPPALKVRPACLPASCFLLPEQRTTQPKQQPWRRSRARCRRTTAPSARCCTAGWSRVRPACACWVASWHAAGPCCRRACLYRKRPAPPVAQRWMTGPTRLRRTWRRRRRRAPCRCVAPPLLAASWGRGPPHSPLPLLQVAAAASSPCRCPLPSPPAAIAIKRRPPRRCRHPPTPPPGRPSPRPPRTMPSTWRPPLKSTCTPCPSWWCWGCWRVRAAAQVVGGGAASGLAVGRAVVAGGGGGGGRRLVDGGAVQAGRGAVGFTCPPAHLPSFE